MTLEDVKQWYAEHGHQSELPGERTWIGRLQDYETFLVYHEAVWDDLCRFEDFGQLPRIIEPNIPLYEMLRAFKSEKAGGEQGGE